MQHHYKKESFRPRFKSFVGITPSMQPWFSPHADAGTLQSLRSGLHDAMRKGVSLKHPPPMAKVPDYLRKAVGFDACYTGPHAYATLQRANEIACHCLFSVEAVKAEVKNHGAVIAGRGKVSLTIMSEKLFAAAFLYDAAECPAGVELMREAIQQFRAVVPSGMITGPTAGILVP